ncbi:MAG: 2-oxoglutarate dehydrogenase complex dihydrolipoyllysine-residue succinyltransferase [Bdellovibrionaceae bacterium]|nr:2-oxoglutarate dehydrogenase complex dihydrolipoyllysine-residue succinyltransferase [Pseudobdellovibrionaceae bacterium]
MKIDLKIPTVGESISEATIGSWAKKDGEFVKRNEILMSIETDKASVEVVAENDGVLHVSTPAGQTVKIGAVVGFIDTEGKATANTATVNVSAAASAAASAFDKPATPPPSQHLSPAVNRIVHEKGLDASTIPGTGKEGRLTKGDVLAASSPAMPVTVTAPTAQKTPAPSPVLTPRGPSKQGDKKLVPMTTIRKRIAERLVQAQHTAALLTTFNEIDMTKVTELRAKYKDKFKEKYGINLGFNGFFVKAAVEALKEFPAVNAWIIGNDIEFHNYYNIGIAVSTEKGLMVPNIKDADTLSLAGVELAIRDLASKGRDGKISIDDLSGGTFTITNGGVFGSLLSTPILNSPQSGILGLHKIQDRPVALNGKVEVRPMMYVALTYDHRIIDGKEAVSFLVKIKEGVEDPERLLLEI